MAAFAGDQRLQPFLQAANPVFGFADPTRRLDQRRVELGAIAADLGYLRFELPVGLRARRHGVFKRPQVFLALRLLLHGLACHRRDLRGSPAGTQPGPLIRGRTPPGRKLRSGIRKFAS